MKIFVSDFCEDDAAIQAYCKEDEQKDAEKMPPKAWFVFFPYSIIDSVKIPPWEWDLRQGTQRGFWVRRFKNLAQAKSHFAPAL